MGVLGFTGRTAVEGEEFMIAFGLSLKVPTAGLLKRLEALGLGRGGRRRVTPTQSKESVSL